MKATGIPGPRFTGRAPLMTVEAASPRVCRGRYPTFAAEKILSEDSNLTFGNR